jgi:hypothetical protein
MKFHITYMHETTCDVYAATAAGAAAIAATVCKEYVGGACRVLSIYQEGTAPPPLPTTLSVVPSAIPKKTLVEHIGDDFRKNHPHLFPPDSA